jgi:DNA-binding LacI/PurR family transcriptional regulator
VLFQRYGALSYVNFDNRAGGEAAARHLAGLGHRRLAVLSPGIHTQLQRLRVEGFLAGAAAAGLDEPVHAVAPGVDWMASGHRAAAPMLDRPAAERPTALFATSDLIALGAVRAARDLGLTVPDDLAVIGYDDAEFAAYAVPSLTTIHSPQEEMAAEAAAILLDLILRRNEGPLQRLLPAQLVVRESCGAHRGGKS